MLTWHVVNVHHADMLEEILNGLSADGWTIFTIMYNDTARAYQLVINRPKAGQ